MVSSEFVKMPLKMKINTKGRFKKKKKKKKNILYLISTFLHLGRISPRLCLEVVLVARVELESNKSFN